MPTAKAASADGTPCAAQNLTLLHRKQSDGMDIGAHNATLEWLAARGTRRKYGAFIFLNSSARGPFFPSYMPRGWQWTMAFTQRLSASVKVGVRSRTPQTLTRQLQGRLSAWEPPSNCGRSRCRK